MTERKIVHFAFRGDGIVYALADDGTVWRLEGDEGVWKRASWPALPPR